MKNKVKSHLQLTNPWHLIATGFGSGLFPVGLGTVGSLVAILFWLLLILLPWQFYFLFVIFSISIGIYLCQRTAKDTQIHDDSRIVWDEFVGIWITFIALPINNWQWVTIGFVIFRLFDIWKPWPICWCDRNLQGGLGIMIDDIIAGLFAAAIIYLFSQY
ncbi:phosphatidylglycerophosphatase A [Candidatus Fukatsuia anoeciicola]|uniref:phosphatidylglycerophosphatase A n=1 Tax=Candidatus Fukatsuia anoeciicola TaxID=2994492 RepID=UPI00346389FF